MDSAVQLLSEWSMRSRSDVKIEKFKKVSCPKKPDFAGYSSHGGRPGRLRKATPPGALAQAARDTPFKRDPSAGTEATRRVAARLLDESALRRLDRGRRDLGLGVGRG